MSSRRVQVVGNILLAVLFAAIGVGAVMDKRLEALPLALIFGAFAVYSVMKVIRVLRSMQG